jgi:enediyne polyketide synthase
LLGPYLERRIAELIPSSSIDVDVDSRAETPQRKGHYRHRPDGKPVVLSGRARSVSHAGSWTLTVGGAETVGCDIEAITGRSLRDWRDLLGGPRFQLADTISRQRGETLDSAATRVWTACECLTKAGAMIDSPLVLASAADDGWLLLTAGELHIATLVTSIDGSDQPLAIAVLARTKHADV